MPDFKFNCPHCKQSLDIPEEMLGQKINCPSCKSVLTLPEPEPIKVDSVVTFPAPKGRKDYRDPEPMNVDSDGISYSEQVPPQTSGLAIASLILGILFISLPAVICGHIARKSIRTSKGRLGGAGLAMAGLVLGYIEMLLVVTIIGILASRAVSNIDEQGAVARQETTHGTIATISLAIQLYGLSHNNELPDSLDELTVAPSEDVEAPLDKNSLSDSWGQPIQYKKLSKVKYELRSGGPDKQIGTEDDLTN